MPEYYFDEDIDTNRLGLISLLASHLELMAKLVQSQMSTKKELCQDMYDKTFLPPNPKKELDGVLFGQTAQPIPSDYQKMLMPVGDVSNVPMSMMNEISFSQSNYQRNPRLGNSGSVDVNKQTTNDQVVTQNVALRVHTRDASTSTNSPLQMDNLPMSSRPGEFQMKNIPLGCIETFKLEKDADIQIHTPQPPEVFDHAIKTQPYSHHHQSQKLQEPEQKHSLQPQPQQPQQTQQPLPPPHPKQQMTFQDVQEKIEPDILPASSPNVITPDINCTTGCVRNDTFSEKHNSVDLTVLDIDGDNKMTDSTKQSGTEKTTVYKCGQCSEIFKARRALIKHMRLHPTEKTYPCDQCGKLFSRNSALINHKRTHTKDKAYICDQCGVTMPTRNDLSSHELTHVGVRPFVCQDCGKSFKKAGALSTHRKLHTGDTPFVCEFCGKAFTSNGNLENHVRVHSGDKPYSCEYCGKAFNTTANLNRHVRIHTGEKPYVCDWCTKAFSQSYALVIHKRIHTGEQPYFCKQCGKTFSDNSTLYKHKRIHKDSMIGKTVMMPNKFRKSSVVQIPVDAVNMNQQMPSLSVPTAPVAHPGRTNLTSVSPTIGVTMSSVNTQLPMVGSTQLSNSSLTPTTGAPVATSRSLMTPAVAQMGSSVNHMMSLCTSTAPFSAMPSTSRISSTSAQYITASAMNSVTVGSILTNGSNTRMNGSASAHVPNQTVFAHAVNNDTAPMTV